MKKKISHIKHKDENRCELERKLKIADLKKFKGKIDLKIDMDAIRGRKRQNWRI